MGAILGSFGRNPQESYRGSVGGGFNPQGIGERNKHGQSSLVLKLIHNIILYTIFITSYTIIINRM